MSTGESLSQEAVEETRQEIRLLVGEISRLSRSEIEPAEFCVEFLQRVVSAMAAVGGVVWTIEHGGRLAPQCQINLPKTGIGEKGEEDQGRHGRLVQKAISEDNGLLVPPHSSSEDGQQAGNPTDYLLVLVPLRTDLEKVGVLEIFQRPDTGPSAQLGYLRFAVQMCDLARDFFGSRQLRSLSDRQVLWSQLEEFVRAVHTGLDVRRTAYTIANEGRRLIECDRVSLAVARGRKCTIEAVSGQDVLEKRSNTVRMLGKLAEMVAASREPVYYTGDTSDMAPQIEEVIQEYVDQSQSKAVGVLPMVRPQAVGEDPEADRDDDQEEERVVGVLIVERIEDNRVPESMLQRIDFVCLHGSSALANAWEHQNLFLMPVWKTLGKAKWVVKARTLPKTLLVLAAAVVVLACLLLWPASFEMEASGVLRPVLRRNVFAGLDGDVEEVLVAHGQRVDHHAIMGAEGTSLPGPIWAEFQDDPQDPSPELTLLQVAEGEGSFVQGGVRRGDTVRARLPTGADEEAEWTEMLVEQVVDPQTLRLRSGPTSFTAGRVQIEIWRITLLARLSSNDLETEILSVTGRQATVYRLMHTTRLLLLKESESPSEQARLSGQLAEWEQELQSLDKKLKLYRDKEKGLLIRAPSEGLVMTWAVGDRLVGYPVRRGQFLMQVADLDGPWQLEVRMPEGQIEHILDSQRVLGEGPKVTYILETDPGTERTGQVTEIHRIAEVRGEEGNTVLIKVKLDDDLGAVKDARLLANRRSGAELTARVHCGRRCLGYVLFHDLIGFVQSRILFRL